MIKTQHPFIHSDGRVDNTLIKTYTDNPENKVLLQVETGVVYGSECVDVYPCRYTYEEIDIPVEEEEEPEAEEDSEEEFEEEDSEEPEEIEE